MTDSDDQTQSSFNADFLRLLIAISAPFAAANNPYTRYFVEKWCARPEIHVPSADVLSGRVLNEESEKVVDGWRSTTRGQYGSGSSDGWKNIARHHLVTSVLNVCFMVFLLNAFDITTLAKNAETYLRITLSEISYAEAILGVIVIAWCTDASGEAKKMRKLLNRERPWLITVDCWCHQVNLILGDIFKRKFGPLVGVLEQAQRVIKWFTHHSRALGILREVQEQRHQRELEAARVAGQEAHGRFVALSLISAVITRWTSHYLACTRLLQLRTDFRVISLTRRAELLTLAGQKREQKEEAEEILAIIDSDDFWVNLGVARDVLQPLAVAANVTQGDDARLDTVLLTLANLYHEYADPRFPEDVRDAVHTSIEKRWKAADQAPFILALIMNPFVRLDVFSQRSPVAHFPTLWTMFSKLYARMYRLEGSSPLLPLGLRESLRAYLDREGIWSEEDMQLEYWQRSAAAKGEQVNLPNLWREHSRPHGDPAGEALADFAVRLLSIVPNSAAVERLFSKFGLIHTKHRNRLHPEKVRKTAIVATDIVKTHGRARSVRRKRKFGAELPTNVLATPAVVESNDTSARDDADDDEGDPSAASFNDLARDLVDDADADELEEILESVDALPPPVTPVVPLSRADGLKLINLFAYPGGLNTSAAAVAGLAHFWKLGQDGLARELRFQEATSSTGTS